MDCLININVHVKRSFFCDKLSAFLYKFGFFSFQKDFLDNWEYWFTITLMLTDLRPQITKYSDGKYGGVFPYKYYQGV